MKIHLVPDPQSLFFPKVHCSCQRSCPNHHQVSTNVMDLSLCPQDQGDDSTCRVLACVPEVLEAAGSIPVSPPARTGQCSLSLPLLSFCLYYDSSMSRIKYHTWALRGGEGDFFKFYLFTLLGKEKS